MGEKFIHLFDLPENLDVAISATSGYRGITACVFAFLAALGAVFFSAVAAGFDIAPTIQHLEYAMVGIRARVANIDWLNAALTIIIFLAAFMPTILELLSAPLAKAGVVFTKWIIFAAAIFDFFTDGKGIYGWWVIYRAPMEMWFGQCSAASLSMCDFGGILSLSFWGHIAGIAIWWVMYLLWMFLFSFGSEMLAIIFAVLFFKLLLFQGIPGVIDMVNQLQGKPKKARNF